MSDTGQDQQQAQPKPKPKLTITKGPQLKGTIKGIKQNSLYEEDGRSTPQNKPPVIISNPKQTSKKMVLSVLPAINHKSEPEASQSQLPLFESPLKINKSHEPKFHELNFPPNHPYNSFISHSKPNRHSFGSYIPSASNPKLQKKSHSVAVLNYRRVHSENDTPIANVYHPQFSPKKPKTPKHSSSIGDLGAKTQPSPIIKNSPSMHMRSGSDNKAAATESQNNKNLPQISALKQEVMEGHYPKNVFVVGEGMQLKMPGTISTTPSKSKKSVRFAPQLERVSDLGPRFSEEDTGEQKKMGKLKGKSLVINKEFQIWNGNGFRRDVKSDLGPMGNGQESKNLKNKSVNDASSSKNGSQIVSSGSEVMTNVGNVITPIKKSKKKGIWKFFSFFGKKKEN